MTFPSISIPAARERVVSLVTLAVAFTWLGDFLFWRHSPGVSVAIFAICSAAALYAMPGGERPTREVWIAVSLLLASSLATFFETSFSNSAVLLSLLAVLAGERHFRDLAAGWPRWSESLVAWLCAGGRWSWLLRTVGESELANVGFDSVATDRAAKAVQILAPAAGLAAVFGIVLCFGNAIFRELVAHLNATVVTWILSFDFSPVRFALWVLFATFALALLRPRPAPTVPRLWARPLPHFLRADPVIAAWQSCVAFLVLNALFFAVNSIDVIYLWGGKTHATLPENVSFSDFVHQGVYSLIFAVLLSAVVIVGVFQQEAKVTRHRLLKALAWAWIAQNLLLIASVVLRLKLYVDAYQLSELRVYVGCFLLLVTAGFCLLALHVVRNEGFGTLLWWNVLATFMLFFLIQFPDVAGYVAEYNVWQWKHEPKRALDLAYLESLGPGAWPALCQVASSPVGQPLVIQQGRETVLRLAASESNQRSRRNWPSFQARRSVQGARLIAEASRIATQ